MNYFKKKKKKYAQERGEIIARCFGKSGLNKSA